ncbi:MAG TPA: hypothetical protein VJR47_08955 [Stellaceae bacterium]|nr:hypothetical protein [Stellaceae bacterium]
MGAALYAGIGFIGVVLVLGGYFANQRGRLAAEDWRFPAVNLAGSCLILVSLVDRWNLPSFVINLAWAAISVLGLVNGARARARGGQGSS